MKKKKGTKYANILQHIPLFYQSSAKSIKKGEDKEKKKKKNLMNESFFQATIIWQYRV